MAYKQPSSGPFKMMGSSPAKQKYDLSKATVDGKHPQTEMNKKYEGMDSRNLFLQGKTRDKEGNVKDIQWAPAPKRPKYKKRPEAKKKSPVKMSEADYQAKKKKRTFAERSMSRNFGADSMGDKGYDITTIDD